VEKEGKKTDLEGLNPNQEIQWTSLKLIWLTPPRYRTAALIPSYSTPLVI